MAEYIDREKLKRNLIDNRSFYPAIVKNAIENAPTEDVVPKSEVEKFIQEIDQIQKDKADVTYLKKQLIAKAKQEVAREIFEKIENILEVDKYGEAKLDVRELYELEKKYIGKDTDVPTNES